MQSYLAFCSKKCYCFYFILSFIYNERYAIFIDRGAFSLWIDASLT
jgi:hypothetical protein